MERFTRKESGRSRQGSVRTYLIIGLAVAAISCFAVLFTWMATKPLLSQSEELDIALRKVLRNEWEVAHAIANRYEPSDLQTDSDRSKQALVRGIHFWELAKKSLEHRIQWMQSEKAVAYLEDSNKLGFPTGYEGLGNFALGMTRLFLSRTDEAAEPLQTAANRLPAVMSEAFQNLVECYLRKSPPDLALAEETIGKWEQKPALGETERQRLLLSRVRVVWARGDKEHAVQLAKSLPSDSELFEINQLTLARILREIVDQTEDTRSTLLNEIIDTLKPVVKSSRTSPSERRMAMWMMADALHELKRDAEALSMFSSLRIGSPETPEALMSGVAEIEIMVEQGQGDDAITTAKFLTSHMNDEKLYRSRFIHEDEMRRRLNQSAKRLMEQQEYQQAIDLAKVLPHWCTESDRVRIQSQAYLAWAKQSQSAEIASVEGDSMQLARNTGRLVSRHDQPSSLTRSYFEMAGSYLERLSNLELLSPDFSDVLWQAIEAYRQARSFDACNRLLDRYLELEPRAKWPRAMLVKAENQVAEGNLDLALVTLRRCMETFQGNPILLKVRLLAAQTLSEQSKFEEAANLLLENLYESNLTPESETWGESLFQLGTLLYRQGDILYVESRQLETQVGQEDKSLERLEESHDQLLTAIERLEESLQRFGDDPRNSQTLYYVAQAYRHAAKWPDELLKQNKISVEERRRLKVQQRRELLQSALKVYVKLRNQLNSSASALDLTPTDQNMLRNSYFGEADLLFELGDFPTSLAAYRSAANRFLNEPEALEALVQIAECQRQLGNHSDAKRSILQARQLLDRIPAELDDLFVIRTRFDRQGWVRLLDWLAKIK